MTTKINGKSITEWSVEWGVSRQAASSYFKENAHLSVDEIILKRQAKKTDGILPVEKTRSNSKWVKISGKSIKEWALEWDMTDNGAIYRLEKIYPDHYKHFGKYNIVK